LSYSGRGRRAGGTRSISRRSGCGPPQPRPMRCWLWPRPLRSAHPVRITAWADAAGTGSDPASVIIDA